MNANQPNTRDHLLSIQNRRWTPSSTTVQWLSVIVAMIRYLRPSSHLWASSAAPVPVRSAYFRPSELGRAYATHSDLGRGPSTSTRSRKNISVLSDDGRLQWDDLSGREKVSRATQQSFNFVVVLAGAVLTVWQRGTDFRWKEITDNSRVVSSHYSTSKSSPRTAAHGSSRKRLGASRTTRGARICWVIGDSSRRMARALGADGRGIGR